MPRRSAHHPKRFLNRDALGPACRLVAVSVISLSALVGRPSPPQAVLADEATPVNLSSGVDYSQRAAATWLYDQQLPDGGFPGPSGTSDPETTIDAVLVAYALGLRFPLSDVLASAREYLLVHGPGYAARESGNAARLALAVIAFGEDPGAFGGEDLTPCDNVGGVGGINLFALFTEPSDPPVPGAIPIFKDGDVRDQAFVLLALAAMYVSIPDAALEPLRASQAPNGGWAQDGSSDSAAADAVTTALVIQALAETDLWDEPSDPDMDLRGIEFLRSLQVSGGGFAYDSSEPNVADVAATAAVIQALIAAGENPVSPQWGNAPQALADFQTSSGGFKSSPGEDQPNLHATLLSVPAMLEMPMPIAFVCLQE